MPRSTTIWAAALVLASLSGSGTILATAEAMPAPGPQETAGRPRYYFPRHVKRQIVTNATAPASSTSSTLSSSSTADLQSGQPDITSLFGSFFNPPGKSSGSDAISDTQEPTRTKTVEVVVTPSPVSRPTDSTDGTGNRRPDPIPSSDGRNPPRLTSSSVASTDGLPDSIVLPNPKSTPTPSPSDTFSAPADVGSTGKLPESIVQPTSTLTSSAVEPDVSSSRVGSTGRLPETIVQPSSSSVPDATSETVLSTNTPPIASTGGLPSSIVQPTELPSVGSTGVLPTSIVLPTERPATTGEIPSSIVLPSEPATSPLVPLSGVASTGGVPESIVPPSSSASPVDNPTSTKDTTILGPFIIPTSTGGLPDTIVQPTLSQDLPTTTEVAPSIPISLPTGQTGELPTGTGVLPASSNVFVTSDPVVSSDTPPVSLPTSGIVVGITTAFGTTQADPTTSSDTLPIPTSESLTQSEVVTLRSSLLSELPSVVPTGVIPSITIAPTSSDIIPDPLSTLVSDLSSILSGITSDVNSVVSSVATALPTSILDVSSIVSSVDSQISSVVPSSIIPSDPVPVSTIVSSVESSLVPTIPTATSGILPTVTTDISIGTGTTPAPTGPTTVPTASSIPTYETSSTISISDLPSSGSVLTSGITVSTGTGSTLPTLTVTGISSTTISTGSAIQTSDVSSTLLPSTQSSSITNATGDASTASATPSSTTFFTPTPTPSSTSDSSSLATKPTSPSQPIFTIVPTATNSETTYAVGTSIIQEATTVPMPSPSATSGISPNLPAMIAPPSGLPSRPKNSFLGQIGFKWPLNYPFVCANDGGNQIFTLLPIAIANALNITLAEVPMVGLKPFDTTPFAGFITTMAIFYIPADLNSTLQAQLRNPPDPFWHNKNEMVNQLTSLINTAFPLAAGGTLDTGNLSPSGEQPSSPTGNNQGGGAMGGDIGASRKVNPTSAGIASATVFMAMAYGAAMFFVARRYRNKRMAHNRSPSVPSTGRFTQGSMTGGGAWMSGARGPSSTPPGGRDSRGSNSSNGRSIRTQQISAPVMAENSLGWN